ncbi:MAG: metallophosphoesterase family protein [bacterium]|nr:MAG: metallophosphoesterase family protein [bacterium]
MEIGILSDTHNRLPEDIKTHFSGVDLILHAGDIGDSPILQKLKHIAPTQAVYGNTDIYKLSSVLPARISLNIENLQIYMQHNIGNIHNFWGKLRNRLDNSFPDIVVFGHTHRPVFEKVEDTLFINPGSVSQPRGGYPASILRLTILAGTVRDHCIIELA